MILRRLMHHIKDQNWFIVALDVIVVILGVYIGIYLGDAADRRTQQKNTLDALLVIDAQLALDLANVDRISHYRTEKLVDPKAAISLLNQAAPDMKALGHHLMTMNKRLYTFFPKTSGYSALKDRGLLAHIKNPTLQQTLANLYDEVYVRNTVVMDESDSNALNYDRDILAIYWDLEHNDFIGDAALARPRLQNAAHKTLSNSEWLVQFLTETVRPAIVDARNSIAAYYKTQDNR